MINQGTILGRIGKIETNTSASGVKVTKISIVTSKRYTKNGEKTEKVTWHNVTAFQKLAEIAEKYVSIGDLVYVQGEMENQKYTDNSGAERIKYYIVANTIQLMPRSKEKPAEQPKQVQDEAFEDDDLPW